MNILIIHRNFFFDGGDSTYAIKQANALAERGHQVDIFTMEGRKNLDIGGKISLHEVPNRISIYGNTRYSELSKWEKFKYGINSLFSITAAIELSRLLNSRTYDLAHLHSIHHVLTVSILLVLRRKKIPVVWTLHDYKFICPASNLYRNGMICKKCPDLGVYNAIKFKCKHDSIFASINVVLGHLLEKFLRVRDIPLKYIAPSQFLADIMLHSTNITPNRITVLHNFVENTKSNNKKFNETPTVLFFGRLTEEKGIRLIPDIAKQLPSTNFEIIGDGPLRKWLIDKIQIQYTLNVVVRDFMNIDTLAERIVNSSFVILPSQWYENFPFALLETFSLQKTAIASKIGGIPELIQDGVNGLLVDSYYDPSSWVKAINTLLSDKLLLNELENNAANSIHAFSPQLHFKKLERIYSTVKSVK